MAFYWRYFLFVKIFEVRSSLFVWICIETEWLLTACFPGHMGRKHDCLPQVITRMKRQWEGCWDVNSKQFITEMWLIFQACWELDVSQACPNQRAKICAISPPLCWWTSLSFILLCSQLKRSLLTQANLLPPHTLASPSPSCVYKLIAWRRKQQELHIKAGSCQALLKYLPGWRGWNLPTRSLEGKQTPFLIPFPLPYCWARVHLPSFLTQRTVVCLSVSNALLRRVFHMLVNDLRDHHPISARYRYCFCWGANHEHEDHEGEVSLSFIGHHIIQQAKNGKDPQLGDISAKILLKSSPMDREIGFTRPIKQNTPTTHLQGFNITISCLSLFIKEMSSPSVEDEDKKLVLPP